MRNKTLADWAFIATVIIVLLGILFAIAFGGEYDKNELRDGGTWMTHVPDNDKGVACTTAYYSDTVYVEKPQDVIGYFVYFDSLGQAVTAYWQTDSNYCKGLLYNAWEDDGPFMLVAEDTVNTVDEVDTTLIDCSATGGLVLGQYFYSKFIVVSSDSGSVEDGITDSVKAKEFLRGILR